jgi:hypothetical protein
MPSSAPDGTATPSRSSPAAAQQPGRRAQRHRVEPGQQRTEERGRPAAGLPEPESQHIRQLPGPPAQPGQDQRRPAGHLDRDHVVPRLHRADEGEADPLRPGLPGDQQRVVVDPHLGQARARASAGRDDLGGEDLGLAHSPRGGRRVVPAAVTELGEQLRPHHAQPAELDHVPAGQGDPDRERFGFSDGRDGAERDAQHAFPGRREHERPGRHLHIGLSVLELLARRGRQRVLSRAHPGHRTAQSAGVPHSPQNRAPLSGVPQLPQNFCAACAAASA